MDRRTYLTTTAMALGVGVAGCQNGQETTAEQQTSGPTTATGSGDTDSSGDAGLTIGTEAGIEVTYEDSLVTDSIVTSADATQAEDGRRFALLELSVRNNTGEATELPGGERFELTAGNNAYRRTTVTDGGGFGAEPGRIQQPVLGDEYRTSGRVDAGAVTSGWLVVSVPVDRSEFTLELTEVTAESGETPSWSVVADATDLATCSVSVDGPQTVTQGTEAAYTMIAENTGNRPVRCYRQVTATCGQQEQTTTVARSLDPGATHETTLSITPRATGEFTVASNVETHVETPVAVPTFQFGESWTSPDGLRVTVETPQFAQEATYEPDLYRGQNSLEAGADSKFAFFNIQMTNTGTEQNLDFPGWRNVRVERGDGTALARMYRLEREPETWISPVSGTPFPEATVDYDPGEGRSAWFLAEVPTSITPSDIYLKLTTPGIGFAPEYGAKWTSG